MGQKKVLRGISDIRRFFHRNETPTFFISATNFNLLGMDEWCKNFKFINYIDCYDGRHPKTFVPNEAPHPQFNSIEDINNYLLQHKEVLDYVRIHERYPKAVFLMFDERPSGSPGRSGSRSGFRRRGCAPVSTTRSIRCASGTRQACRACPTCSPR